MNFVLVPFLLAVRLPSNDNEVWRMGPVYNFRVRVSMITQLKQDEGRNYGVTVVTDLKCRPREPESLVCKFENARIARLNPKGFTEEETLPPGNSIFFPYGIGSRTFEVKFNEQGIRNYVIQNDERYMSQWLMDTYRLLVNQLSIGVSLKQKSNSFETKENSTVGECQTEYKLTRKDLPKEERKKDRFQLDPIGDFSIEQDQILTIERHRDLDKCTDKPAYFFGLRHAKGLILRDTTDKLITSATRTMISRWNYTSETVNVLQVIDSSNEILGKVLDHVILTLDSVEPAKDELPSIPNPKDVGVTVDG